MSKLGINVPAIRMKALSALPCCMSSYTGTHLPTVSRKKRSHTHQLTEASAEGAEACAYLEVQH